MVGTITFNGKIKSSYRYAEISAYDLEHFASVNESSVSEQYIVDISTGYIYNPTSNYNKVMLTSPQITDIVTYALHSMAQNRFFTNFAFNVGYNDIRLKTLDRAKTKNPHICPENMLLSKGLYLLVYQNGADPLEISMICDALNYAYWALTGLSGKMFYPFGGNIYADITMLSVHNDRSVMMQIARHRSIEHEYTELKSRYALKDNNIISHFQNPALDRFDISHSMDFAVVALDEYRLLKHLTAKYVSGILASKKFDAKNVEILLDLPNDKTVLGYVSDCKGVFVDVCAKLRSFGYFESDVTGKYASADEIVAVCCNNAAFEALSRMFALRRYEFNNNKFASCKICDMYCDGV